MKTKVFLLAVLIFPLIAIGQIIQKNVSEVEVTPPTFKGEFPNSVNECLQSRVEYPSTELKWGTQGTVVAGFVVTTEGKLKNIHIINSVSQAIDMEVIRALKSTDKMWTPGIKNGEAIEMPNEVSVVFKLYPEDNFTEIAKKYFVKGNYALFVKNRPEKALKYFTMCIKLLPNDETLLAMRGFCKYKLGDETGANRDWDRSKILAKKHGTNAEIENLPKISNNSQEYDKMFRTLIK